MLLDIDDKIKLVLSETGFTFCNCLYIDDKIQAIIDTGADIGSLQAVHPENIDRVINSHHHIDHTRGNKFFANAQISIHEFDAEPLSNIEAFEHFNSFDRWPELMPGTNYEDTAKSLGLLKEDFADNFKVDNTLNDGEIIDFGKTKMQVIHTPGHSKGHCSFWFPEQDFLFCGDICLTKAGPWYGELFSNPGDMIDSINKLIELKPGRMASCHIKKVCTDSTARLTEFRDRIYKREERILKYLTGSTANIDQIAQQKLIYRMHVTPFVLFWEKLMVLKHIQRLLESDMIEEVEPGIYQAK